MVKALNNKILKKVRSPYIEVINFQKLKKIHSQKFKTNAKMLPEDNIVLQMHHVHNILRVILFQKLQNFKFNSRLVHIFLLVLDYFQSDFTPCLVINTLQSGAKWSFSQEFYDLVPVTYMVILRILIITILVIISKVMLQMRWTLNFLSLRRPYEVNFWIL